MMKQIIQIYWMYQKMKERPDNNKIIQEEINEDWDPNLAVEALF
ncbi:14860_t:CDS:1, partial [Funneliformis mosseae]